MLAAPSHTAWALAAWNRAVARRQAQRASELASDERLTDSVTRLKRSGELLTESGRRLGGTAAAPHAETEVSP
jgi:hypothetical protein